MPDLNQIPDPHPFDNARDLARLVPAQIRSRLDVDLPVLQRLIDLACRAGFASETMAEDLEDLGQRYIELSRVVSAASYRGGTDGGDDPGSCGPS
ncbi:MAG: hypothetical protein PGN34_15390 [Methylobacterium frigidaeris]